MMSELSAAIAILIEFYHDHFESLHEKGYTVQDSDEVIAANATLSEAGQDPATIKYIILSSIAKQKKG